MNININTSSRFGINTSYVRGSFYRVTSTPKPFALNVRSAAPPLNTNLYACAPNSFETLSYWWPKPVSLPVFTTAAGVRIFSSGIGTGTELFLVYTPSLDSIQSLGSLVVSPSPVPTTLQFNVAASVDICRRIVGFEEYLAVGPTGFLSSPGLNAWRYSCPVSSILTLVQGPFTNTDYVVILAVSSGANLGSTLTALVNDTSTTTIRLYFVE